MKVPLDWQAQRSPQRLQLADPDVPEFRLAQAQVAESKLCGPTNYGESAAADPESPRTICGQCSP